MTSKPIPKFKISKGTWKCILGWRSRFSITQESPPLPLVKKRRGTCTWQRYIKSDDNGHVLVIESHHSGVGRHQVAQQAQGLQHVDTAAGRLSVLICYANWWWLRFILHSFGYEVAKNHFRNWRKFRRLQRVMYIRPPHTKSNRPFRITVEEEKHETSTGLLLPTPRHHQTRHNMFPFAPSGWGVSSQFKKKRGTRPPKQSLLKDRSRPRWCHVGVLPVGVRSL